MKSDVKIFATKEPNGLLLYNGRFNEKHDFIAMEIISEQIQLTFSAGECSCFCSSHTLYALSSTPDICCCSSGETQTTVSPFILGGVSDGQWHTVEVHYYNKVRETAHFILYIIIVIG
ncbi:hypothetical protein XENOCAPTIV_030377 [Xenoophorus captivus]|uniref:Laminin G domain-containing protein n=1 Tax=Xenoophorus captivus TaxID=1517983 RepID=A0ABV0SCC4_9TELE